MSFTGDVNFVRTRTKLYVWAVLPTLPPWLCVRPPVGHFLNVGVSSFRGSPFRWKIGFVLPAAEELLPLGSSETEGTEAVPVSPKEIGTHPGDLC